MFGNLEPREDSRVLPLHNLNDARESLDLIGDNEVLCNLRKELKLEYPTDLNPSKFVKNGVLR